MKNSDIDMEDCMIVGVLVVCLPVIIPVAAAILLLAAVGWLVLKIGGFVYLKFKGS